MTTDVYKAPESEIINEQGTEYEFYVVSPKKFLILMLSTLGIYSIYWFYKHWAQYKAKHDDNMWPVIRGIFHVFFAHSLFDAIQTRLDQMKSEHFFSAGGTATFYVLFFIADRVINRLAMKDIGSPTTDMMALIFLPLMTWMLYQAQVAANIASGCSDGSANEKITAANAFWIALGVLYWGVYLLGLYVITGGDLNF